MQIVKCPSRPEQTCVVGQYRGVTVAIILGEPVELTDEARKLMALCRIIQVTKSHETTFKPMYEIEEC